MKADEQRWAGKLDWRDFKKGRTDADIDSRPARKRPTKMGTFIVSPIFLLSQLGALCSSRLSNHDAAN